MKDASYFSLNNDPIVVFKMCIIDCQDSQRYWLLDQNESYTYPSSHQGWKRIYIIHGRNLFSSEESQQDTGYLAR